MTNIYKLYIVEDTSVQVRGGFWLSVDRCVRVLHPAVLVEASGFYALLFRRGKRLARNKFLLILLHSKLYTDYPYYF